MKTLAAMTDSVFQQLEGGWMSDDTRLSYDLVRDKILRVRAEVIGKVYSRMIGSLPDSLFQKCCIDLECVEECGSGLYKKKGSLPGLLGLIGNRSIRFVGSVDGTAYERKTTSGKRWENFQPYAYSSKPAYRIIGDEIEIIDAPMGLEVILVEGIFADPSACPPCVEDDELIIPVPSDLLDSIEVQSLKELQQIWMMRFEKRNDATPNK